MRKIIHQQVNSVALCSFVLLLLGFMPASAQQNAVLTGAVLNEKSEVLAGVTIAVAGVSNKESYTGTSDDKGVFYFRKLVAGNRYDLSVSYIGYETGYIRKYLVKQGENNSLLIKLRASGSSLNEVVVTALGIKREEKSLGYAAQSVN